MKYEYTIDINLDDENVEEVRFEGFMDFFSKTPLYHACFNIYINKDCNILSILKNKDSFEEAYSSFIKSEEIASSFYKELTGEEETEEDDLFAIKNGDVHVSYDSLIKSNYKLFINGSKEDIVYFLNKYSLNKEQKVIICNEVDNKTYLSIKDDAFISYLIKNIKLLDNIYVNSEGNHEEVSLLDYKQTVDFIDNIVNRVKSYDFSPLEQLMYIYDIVRDRKYKFEAKGESPYESRDLSKVVLGDSIVCLGFAQIFDKICQKLDFVSSIEHLYSTKEKSGHARNCVYVVDEKYKTKGLLFFDTTFDSKKGNNNSHFDSYKFFAREYYKSDRYDISKPFDSIIEIMRKYYKNGCLESAEYYRLSNIVKSLTGEELINSDEYLKEIIIQDIHNVSNETLPDLDKKINHVKSLFYPNITRETFVKVLSNVRIHEYYENPEKYPISTRKLTSIEKKSFIVQRKTSEQRMLDIVFGLRDRKAIDVIRKNDINKRIQGVKLAKTLRLTLEKKQKEESESK